MEDFINSFRIDSRHTMLLKIVSIKVLRGICIKKLKKTKITSGIFYSTHRNKGFYFFTEGKCGICTPYALEACSGKCVLKLING